MRRCHAGSRQASAGHDYTYLYPGIRKVVQAAGRVIRTLDDRGSVHLIDDRFARPGVLKLLPEWWRVELDDRRTVGPAQEAVPITVHCPGASES